MIKNKYTQKIFIWVYLFEGWGNPGNTPAWQKSHNQTKKPNPNFSQYFTLRWIPGTSSATIKSIIQTKKLGISKGILLKADKTKIYLFLQSLYFLSVLSLILLMLRWDEIKLCKGEREPAVCMYSLLYQFPLCLLSVPPHGTEARSCITSLAWWRSHWQSLWDHEAVRQGAVGRGSGVAAGHRDSAAAR